MSLIRKSKHLAKYLTPVPVKKLMKFTFYSAQDAVSTIKGTRDPIYPPKRLNFVGSNEFKAVGDEFMEHFVKLGGLKRDDKVLDVGCGIGRMAIPLTAYLSDEGLYRGFDIDKRGVKWCTGNITPRRPNFEFNYVDVYNKYYNKKGKTHAAQFEFPYGDGEFTFAFATSVFTHMLPQQVTQYLGEIARVLKPGGTAFLTFFSIDEIARVQIKKGLSQALLNIPFGHDGVTYYSHKNVPEAEIGFMEDWIHSEMDLAGLDVENVYHGKWSKRPEGYSYQDIYVVKKR